MNITLTFPTKYIQMYIDIYTSRQTYKHALVFWFLKNTSIGFKLYTSFLTA